MTNNEQKKLANSITEFKSKKRPSSFNMRKEKENVINDAVVLFKGKEIVFKAFENGTFSLPT